MQFTDRKLEFLAGDSSTLDFYDVMDITANYKCAGNWFEPVFIHCFVFLLVLYPPSYFEAEYCLFCGHQQQSPFGDRKISSIQPQNRRGVQNQQEHHIILTKYEAVHPKAVSENNSSSGMLIILTISQTVCINIYLKGPNNQRHSKWIHFRI